MNGIPTPIITKDDWYGVNEPTPELDLYTMGLHDEIYLNDTDAITRVPGGWLYHCQQGDVKALQVTTTFVPYNNEFSNEHHQPTSHPG